MENKSEASSYSHILKYTSIFGGMQGLNILIGIIRTKLVALILGPVGMGLVSLFNSTISFISSGTNLGLPNSSVKTLSEIYEQGDEEQLRHKIRLIRSLSFFVSLSGVIVCILLSSTLDMFTFSWGSHSLHFALLSPIVGMMAIIGGEMAILKSVRKLKSVAVISTINMVAALIISVPIYYIFGQSGIIPALTLMTLFQLLITIHCTRKLFPFEMSFKRNIFCEGREMIHLGLAFLVSGLFTTGADFVIRSYLSKYANLETLGFFNAGFMLTTTYAGMVFVALETDYFPRLSGVNKDVIARNLMVNRQIEVTFLLIAPMLLAFMIFMPLAILLLYSSSFISAVSMAQIIILALYLRSIKLPIAYLTLAKADSKAFMLLEGYSAILMVTAVIIGYQNMGLDGAGWGLVITGLVDLIVIYLFAHFRYHYVITSQVIRYVVYQLPLAILAFISTRLFIGTTYWVIGIILTIVSLGVSIFILHKKTSLWNKLISRWKSKVSY